MKKRLLKIFGFIIIAFSCNPHVINAYTSNNELEAKKEILQNHYETELAQKVDASIKNTDDSYPSYYGGMYINDDSSNLVIQIVKTNIPKANSTHSSTQAKEYASYNHIINMDKTIKVEYVDYSYTELNDVYQKVVEYMLSNDDKNSNLKGVLIDVLHNRVVVELADNCHAKQEEFKRVVMDSNLISFIEIDRENSWLTDSERVSKENSISPYANTTLQPGQKLFLTTGTCSMGYRVKIDGKYGFLTSGHCVSGLNEATLYGNVKKYMTHHKVDAAFIEVNTLYNLSNTLKYGSGTLNKNSYANLSVGSKIGKSGAASGYSTGTVKSLNYTTDYTVNGEILTDLVATDLNATHGDSGGAVFTTNDYTVAGLVEGYSPYGSAFINAKYIYSSFAYTRY